MVIQSDPGFLELGNGVSDVSLINFMVISVKLMANNCNLSNLLAKCVQHFFCLLVCAEVHFPFYGCYSH